MRQWHPEPTSAGTAVLTDLVGALGAADFAQRALQGLRALVPAASWSVYRTGSRPELLLSASAGIPDTTQACWRAYLSGPHRSDRSLAPPSATAAGSAPLVCHVVAGEVLPEHRARVYEAHGMAERVSVVRADPGDGLLAVNLYRHDPQRAFRDAELHDFGELASAVLALVDKQLWLLRGVASTSTAAAPTPRQRLLALCPSLTARELDICERLLRGLTHDGIAADLKLAVPTVKTYRNRAFGRLGIHFRSELYARVMEAGGLAGRGGA